jgi:hypothetical protein
VALSGAGDPDYAQWDRGNIRGPGRKRFVGTDVDPETGEKVNVYQLDSDDEWNDLVDWDLWSKLK